MTCYLALVLQSMLLTARVTVRVRFALLHLEFRVRRVQCKQVSTVREVSLLYTVRCRGAVNLSISISADTSMVVNIRHVDLVDALKCGWG